MHCAPSNTIFVLPWSLGRVVLVVSFIETSVSLMVSRWAEKLKDGFCVRAVSSLECGLFSQSTRSPVRGSPTFYVFMAPCG
uniref:Putative secreted protein n=1 Tax=Ixodes scapularis TaxID=6945 RepID=A0A4D5RE69_IXOSC